MEVATFLGVLAIFILVGANACFVAAEFSLVKARTSRIELRVFAGNATAGIARGQGNHLGTYSALAHVVVPIFTLVVGTLIADELARAFRPTGSLLEACWKPAGSLLWSALRVGGGGAVCGERSGSRMTRRALLIAEGYGWTRNSMTTK
jgi:CBS domain containing-hemolysin-like protein